MCYWLLGTDNRYCGSNYKLKAALTFLFKAPLFKTIQFVQIKNSREEGYHKGVTAGIWMTYLVFYPRRRKLLHGGKPGLSLWIIQK